MLDSLRGALNLWSMDDLIFNQGIRQYTYLGGIFPTAWEATLWTLFSVFEIFGAAMLMAGVIVSVVHKALSTTNVIERMHLMEKIQTLIVCAVILAILPFALRIMLSFSSSLTQIGYDMLLKDDAGKTKEINEFVKRFTACNGTIGGIAGQFMYFGIQIYFNFYYAVRSFSVPVLIIMSPLFVCGICLSSSKKQLAVQWSKELISFIFMQPIHAFCMGLLLILPISSRGLDNIIILYAIIPLSQTLKPLFFGQTSGFAERTADRAKGTATKLLAAAGIGAVTAGVKGGAAVLGGLASRGSDNDSSEGSTDSDSSGNSDPGPAPPVGNTSPMGNASGGGTNEFPSSLNSDIIPKIKNKALNTNIGKAISKVHQNRKDGKDFSLSDANDLSVGAAKTLRTGARTALRGGGGMALGAIGGMIGAVGGRDLGRTLSNGGPPL